jgi:hypothetical protein
VLVAEAIAHFFPRLVELHNYSSANSLSQKMYNWNTLNAKVRVPGPRFRVSSFEFRVSSFEF